MSLPILKIGFIDFWPDFKPEESSFYKLLSQKYILDFNPPHDYIIASVYGNNHFSYDCVKILYTGENNTPDFNYFDYAIGFDYLEFGDRYFRMPNYVHRKEYYLLEPGKNTKITDDELLNRDFCSIVVSNNWCASPIREEFYKRLSKYKTIASGGRFMNNVGGPVEDKLEFCRRYKFNIAFENSSYPGYVTEKIIDALAADTVPIYYGDPLIGNTINLGRFIQLMSFKEIDKIIERIIELDKDDNAYIALCHAHIFPESRPWDYFYKRFENYLFHIFEQPLEQARRCCSYGHQEAMRSERRREINDANLFRKLPSFIKKITRKIIK